MGAGQLDLVLVNPNSRTTTYQTLGRTLAAIENPVWAGLLAGFVRRRGYSVAVVEAGAEGLDAGDVAERIGDLDPRLVAVVVYGHQPSASTQNMTGASAVVAAIKARDLRTKVLMVGGHVAALPERTLQEEACDFVSVDEGLSCIVDLIEALRANVEPDLGKVSGLMYRDNGGVVSNGAAPIVMDLDRQLADPGWDLLPMARYRAHNWHCFGDLRRQPYAAMYTTLGCPYRCTFCCIQAPFKRGERQLGLSEQVNSYRFWSPAHVVRQIDTLVNGHGVRNIKFADEMFVLNRRHVEQICHLLIARRYDLNIWAYARVDTVKDGMLEKLRDAGFTWLALGIEAASDRVLTDVDKRYREDEVYDTVRKIKAAGINVIGNYIFGLPEDDRASMQETLNLALDLNTEFANFYAAMAYPGSALYRTAIDRGWPLPSTWSGYSQHGADTLPLPTRHLSAVEVLRFRDNAFQTYFTSPSYLDLVRRTFGQETLTHIHDMTAHRLERSLYARA